MKWIEIKFRTPASSFAGLAQQNRMLPLLYQKKVYFCSERLVYFSIEILVYFSIEINTSFINLFYVQRIATLCTSERDN
jgi:hypothetical protein